MVRCVTPRRESPFRDSRGAAFGTGAACDSAPQSLPIPLSSLTNGVFRASHFEPLCRAIPDESPPSARQSIQILSYGLTGSVSRAAVHFFQAAVSAP